MKLYCIHVTAMMIALASSLAANAQEPSIAAPTTALPELKPATVEAVTASAPIELVQEPLKLLGDRLNIRMPKGAEIARRGTGPAPDDSMAQQETRIVCDMGRKKLMLMVYETFKTATTDMDEKITTMASQMSSSGSQLQMVVLPNDTGLKVTQAIFPTVATDKQIAPICSAWIVGPDKTVQVLQCYANPKSQQDVEEFRSLWTDILKTLAPGKARLDTKARTQEFKLQGEQVLSLELPEGSVATAGHGPDFMLYSIDRLVPFGGDSDTIGIYSGAKAQYRSGARGMPGFTTDTENGDLLGAPVEWRKYTGPKATIMEAIRPFPEAGQDMKLHVFFSSTSPDKLAECRKTVGTMKLGK